MLSRGEDKPPSRRSKRYWKVAVLANIKDEKVAKPEGVPPDASPTLITLKPSMLFERPSKQMVTKPFLFRLMQIYPTRFEMKSLIFASTSPRD